MGYLKLSILLLAVAAFTSVAGQNLITPRLINGVPIDTLRKFPHHVTVEPIYPWSSEIFDHKNICGGSILNERFVLTSATCLSHSSRVKLHFERLYLNETSGSYTAVVNSDAVQVYPTYYDDIALVKLPFSLIFSDTLKPIQISTVPVNQLQNKLAVLPGFNESALSNSGYLTLQQQQLNYAMLNVIPNESCKSQVSEGVLFDEYLQFCASGWGSNPNAPCINDSGNGLISGWPAKPELIGIYTDVAHNCRSNVPGVFLNVAKYKSWIDSIINSA